VRIRILILAAACAAAMVGSGATAASAQTAPTGGFGAAPAHPDPADLATRAYFKPVLTPGGTASDELEVTSTSDAPVQLLIYPVDGLTGQTSGAVYANRDNRAKKAGTWVAPSISALSLPPHGQQLVPFTVRAPANATPGDHLAGLAVEDANPSRSGGQFSVTEVFRTVVGVDITVPGPAEPALRVGTLGLKALPGTNVAALSVQIGDSGRKLVKPLLRVSMRGPNGYRRTFARNLDTILPGDTIAYPLLWPDSLARGTYHVVVRATGAPTPVTRAATVRLGVALRGTSGGGVPTSSGIPILIIVLGVTGAVAVGLGLWLLRRYRDRALARRLARRRTLLSAARRDQRFSPRAPARATEDPVGSDGVAIGTDEDLDLPVR
jgi:Bacterial protein of unknown function (DUF916)